VCWPNSVRDRTEVMVKATRAEAESVMAGMGERLEKIWGTHQGRCEDRGVGRCVCDTCGWMDGWMDGWMGGSRCVGADGAMGCACV
jgi:hypothetical protein